MHKRQAAQKGELMAGREVGEERAAKAREEAQGERERIGGWHAERVREACGVVRLRCEAAMPRELAREAEVHLAFIGTCVNQVARSLPPPSLPP